MNEDNKLLIESAVQYSWLHHQFERNKKYADNPNPKLLKELRCNMLRLLGIHRLMNIDILKDALKIKTISALKKKGISNLFEKGVECTVENKQYVDKYYNELHNKIMSKFNKLHISNETYH